MIFARSGFASLAFGLSLSAACSSGGSSAQRNAGDAAAEASAPIKVPAKLAIVTDWLNQSLSYVDVDALNAGGATRDAVVASTVAYPTDSPGPLELAITPDRKTALISISSGFFSIPLAGVAVNASNIPTDPGKLIFVDIDTGTVVSELLTGDTPMGIAITPDGNRAFVTNFNTGDMVVVDVVNHVVLDHVPLDVYPEEITFDDTGTVGIVGDSSTGCAHTFAVADPKGTLSPQIMLDGDSGGVAFFPGTKIAFMVQAWNPLITQSGFTVIDVTDPHAPKVLQDTRLPETPIGYPVVAAPKRNSVLVPTTASKRLVVREYALQNNQAVLVNTVDVADASLISALGIAYDGDHQALLAWPSQRAVVTVDLDAKTSRIIPWISAKAGPADVMFR